MRSEIIGSDLKANVEEMHKYFVSENNQEAVAKLDAVLQSLKNADEAAKRNAPEEEVTETSTQESTQPTEPNQAEVQAEVKPEVQTQVEAPVEAQVQAPVSIPQQQAPKVEEQKQTGPVTIEKRNQRLNLIKNDPSMKEAWAYLFKGKILKFWTPHGSNWPMHLLLSDDGYALTMKGKQKWETTIRLDDIDGIWKGYFSNSPFSKPQKLFTKSKDLL